MKYVAALVAICAVGTCGAQLLSWVPIWPLALIEHFRVQMLVGGVVIAGACFAARSRWFDAVVLATLLHCLWLLPDLSRSPRALPANGRQMRVLLLNVLSSNTRFEDVRRLIQDTRPDVVALLEVRDNWLRELAPALVEFSARVEHARTDNFGLALYSRAPLTGSVEITALFPSIVATLDGDVTVVLTHPMPPVDSYYQSLLSQQFDDIAARLRTLNPTAIVLGDFNSTPWSRPFRRLVDATGLCDTRAGFGLQGTFPAESILMRIPIDHALVSCDIGVRARRVERVVGSDHLPVVIDLVMPR